MEITLKEIPVNTQSEEYSDFIPIFVGPYLKENKQYITNQEFSNGYVSLKIDSDYKYYADSLIGYIEYIKIIKDKTDLIISDGKLPDTILISQYVDLLEYNNTISLILFDSSNNIIYTTKITPIFDPDNQALSIILDTVSPITNGTYKYILVSKVSSSSVTYNDDKAYFDLPDDVYQNKVLLSSYIKFKTYYNKPLIYNSYINTKIDFIEPYASLFSLCKNFVFINNIGLSQEVVDRLLFSDSGYYITPLDTTKETVNALIEFAKSSDSDHYKTIIASKDIVASQVLTSGIYTKS